MLVGVRVSAVGKVGGMSCAGGRFSSLIFHCLHFVAAAELDLLIINSQVALIALIFEAKRIKAPIFV